MNEFKGLPTEYLDESDAVTVNDERRHLTELQSRVLRHLWQHHNKIVSPRAIANAIYAPMATHTLAHRDGVRPGLPAARDCCAACRAPAGGRGSLSAASDLT